MAIVSVAVKKAKPKNKVGDILFNNVVCVY